MHFLNNLNSAEWILNIAFQSLIILLLGWGILRLFKSKSAPMRSTVVLLTMGILLILPLMNVTMSSLFHKSFGPTLSIKYEVPLNVKSSAFSLNGTYPSAQIDKLIISSDINEKSNNKTTFGLFWIKIINAFGILWGIGALLFLFRFVYGAVSLKKLKKELIHVSNPKIETVLNELKTVFPHSINTKIYESTLVRSPLVLGFFNPFILLPSETFKIIKQNDLRSVLTHELSHIYHRDQMIGFLQRFITSFNWWNPLIYIISSNLSRAREEISDNHVLLKHNSKEYAECLVNLAEDKSVLGRFSVANAMASSHIPLKERVNLILSKERNMETRIKKSTFVSLVLFSCVLLAFIASYRMTFASDVDENPGVNLVEQEEQTEKEQAVRARGDIKPPKVIKIVEPNYPEEARKKGIEGVVVLESTTDKYGVVQEVKILRSIPALDKAAIDAVKQWIYEPMIIDGEPKSVIFTVTCMFKLDDEKKDKADKSGVKEGVVGEVVGGVEGEVEGGVISGIQGEIEKGVLILREEERPKLIKKVEPIYPKEAIKEGIKGEVNLMLTTDIYGRVEKVKILKSIPELDDAAVEAVKQWVYEPYIDDGKPVKVSFKVTITFRLR
ncbi:TonB family protein [Acidobacteriota bacterium]